MQGGKINPEASVHAEAHQAPQPCKAQAVAVLLPAGPPESSGAPVHVRSSANDIATPVARENSKREDLLPVGVTTYTEVGHTADWGFKTDCFLGTASVICNLGVVSGHMDKTKAMAAQFYSEAELQHLEAASDGLHAKAATRLPPTAFHQTHAVGGGLRRTKMFFGARCERPAPA